MNIAIIGAGLAGAVLAQRLRKAGHAVTIFEKSRGAGGRMATRRTDRFAFDHGAPCFTCETSAFRQFLAPLIHSGRVVHWQGRFVRLAGGSAGGAVEGARFVAAPAMNALCKALLAGVTLQTHVQVAPIEEPHVLHSADGNLLGRFDWIVSTAPGPQTAVLFGGFAPVPLAPDHMTGAFTTMLGFAHAHDPGWDMAEADDPIIASMIRNSTKPGRTGDTTTFVIHARSDWSQTRIDDAPDAVQPVITNAFTRISGIDADAADYAATHRWRYAHANAGVPGGCVFAPDVGLAACGDWCIGGGVEAAFHSAITLAERLVPVQ